MDQRFPTEDLEQPNFSFTYGHEVSFQTVLELLDRIPDELIIVNADCYSALLAGRNAIRTALTHWRTARDYTFRNAPTYKRDPITLLREVLVQCPDEFPSSDTIELGFLEDQQFRESLRLDMSGMNTALSNGEWKAATVLAGSIVEALLLWALQRLDPVNRATAIASGSWRPGVEAPQGNLNRWTLHQFIEVAAGGNVIRAETPAAAGLAKDFRNLIHPGRASRRGQVCDRGTALSAVAAVELVVRDLMP